MDLQTLCWDEGIAAEMGVPTSMLPQIRSSSEIYATVREPAVLAGVPIGGILGDQQAATFGQACLSVGEAKNTYGTGNFMLLNTGTDKVHSRNGLLTTVCYKIGPQDPVYALEGSIAVTGSLVQWLRDNLGMISSAAEIEQLAATVTDNGGVYFVPAFSGLFAPHWRSDARGAIVGLTRYVNRGHLARAVLEATAFQSREVLDAMNADCGWIAGSAGGGWIAGSAGGGAELTSLKVDGGMVGNELLMQFQADILGVPVIRPVIRETTASGAAYAAGLAVGFWSGTNEIRTNWAADRRWDPTMDRQRREELYRQWRKAVSRTLDWVDG
jgi:glycerol kinase